MDGRIHCTYFNEVGSEAKPKGTEGSAAGASAPWRRPAGDHDQLDHRFKYILSVTEGSAAGLLRRRCPADDHDQSICSSLLLAKAMLACLPAACLPIRQASKHTQK